MAESAYPRHHLSSHVYAVLGLGALLVLAITAETLSPSSLFSWEGLIFYMIYTWPDWLKPFFLAVTQLGSPWMLLLLPLLAWANRRRQLASVLFISGGLSLLLAEGVKMMINRPRPAYLLSGVSTRDAYASGSSFPSAHMAIATGLALALLPYLPKKQTWVIFTWISLVGISRVYLGVHSPLDILGGLAVGVLVSSMVHLGSGNALTIGRRRLRSRLQRRSNSN